MMKLLKYISIFITFLGLAEFLDAQPENLETFYDFEDANGFGTFMIGESPNSIEVVNFSVETVDDANLAHSGSKALVLIPGNEGLIKFERGVQNLQFYATETTGGGKLEVNPRSPTAFDIRNGVIDGVARERPSGLPISLPTSIDPGTNPQLLSFVAFTDSQSTTDLTFVNGIRQIKISAVSG